MAIAGKLLNLMQYVKRFGPIGLDQIAAEFKVSKKTIYRDIRALSVLNVPIQYESGRGYKLETNTEFKLDSISINDADLVLFCLYHNPLSNSPFFRQRLMFLKKHLQNEFEKKSEFKKNSIFTFDSTYSGLAEKHYENVAKFLFAIYHKSKVFLLEKESFSKSDALIPIGVSFKESGATLILFSEQGNYDYQIDLEELQGIGISTSRFVERPREILEIERSEIEC